jgi:hypothetical protein
MSATATLAPTHRPHLALRRAGAVFAGLLTIVVLSTATDAVLHATGVYPPYPQRMADELFLLATGYRIVFGIAAGYVAARLAPDQPMRHALALGAIGVVLSTAGAAAMWELGPGWYSLAIIAIALPCAWAGARLRAAQLRQG